MATSHNGEMTLQRVLKVFILVCHICETLLYLLELSKALFEQHKHTLQLANQLRLGQSLQLPLTYLDHGLDITQDTYCLRAMRHLLTYLVVSVVDVILIATTVALQQLQKVDKLWE